MTINRRIVLGFLTFVGILTAVAGITLAQLTAQTSLTGNTLSTGSAELRIATATDSICSTSTHDSISGISTSHVAPGQSATKQFCLKNSSDSDISLNVSAAVNNLAGTLDANLVSVSLECGSNPVTGSLLAFPDSNIVTIAHDTVVLCSITQTLSGTATNSSANQTVTYSVVFTGTQVE